MNKEINEAKVVIRTEVGVTHSDHMEVCSDILIEQFCFILFHDVNLCFDLTVDSMKLFHRRISWSSFFCQLRC